MGKEMKKSKMIGKKDGRCGTWQCEWKGARQNGGNIVKDERKNGRRDEREDERK